ncbi:MAG: phage holin family protein [Geminicoccaceae bacterium]|nr:phage holin family protein [Geminicoccaceae bacterium]
MGTTPQDDPRVGVFQVEPQPHPAPQPRSTSQLLSDLGSDLGNLVRGEIALARAEVQEGLTKMATGAVEIVGAMFLAFVALIILLEALVAALAVWMPAWLAALIVGGTIALVALFMAYRGQANLRKASLLPRRAARHTQADVEMAKEHI